MFERVTSLSNKNTSLSDIKEETLDFLITSLPDIPLRQEQKKKVSKTREELDALIVSIETYGLSKGLVSFANTHGILETVTPSINGLLSLDTEELASRKEDVLAELRNISVEDTPSVEGLGALQWFAMILSLIYLNLIPSIILYTGFTMWNAITSSPTNNKTTTHSQSQNTTHQKQDVSRVATVIPYRHIISYIQSINKVPDVLERVVTLKLPKNQNEYDEFFSGHITKLVMSDLLNIGISLKEINGSDDRIEVLDLVSPVTADITSLGYTEHSLSQLAFEAAKYEHSETELKNIYTKLRSLSVVYIDADSKHYSNKAIDLITDIIHVTMTRCVKILYLTKHTCRTIEHFYSQS